MKVGFIGAGGIARKMGATLIGLGDRSMVERAMTQMGYDAAKNQVPVIERAAVAARDLKRAEAFAEEFGFAKAYGSYEELLADPDVDLVYIALPHSHHREWTLKAVSAGKAVLCEKAFALTEKEAADMIALAEEKNILLTEAIWTRYMPSRKKIDDIIKSGAIGNVKTLSANLGYAVHVNERMVKPELGGGALLDLTVYPLNFASMVLGDGIKKVSASCIMTDTGVDGQNQVMMEYADGTMATVFATMYSLTDRAGWIYGETGALEVQNINNPEAIRLYRPTENNGLVLEKEYDVPPQISGYEYEVIACALALQEGKIECAEMPHAETLEIMRQMDRIRQIWNS